MFGHFWFSILFDIRALSGCYLRLRAPEGRSHGTTDHFGIPRDPSTWRVLGGRARLCRITALGYVVETLIDFLPKGARNRSITGSALLAGHLTRRAFVLSGDPSI